MRKYEYGAVGNGSFLALIDTSADVRWLCWPKFDSSFVFGGLIDEDAGGRFGIWPDGKYSSHQYYRKNTNVLVTEFRCHAGSFRVIDCAPRFMRFSRYYKPLMLMRKLEVLSGTPRVRVKCEPKGDYGRINPTPQLGSNHIEFIGLPNNLRLTSDISLNYILNASPFVLTQDKHLALTWGVPLEAPLKDTCEEFLHNTEKYWYSWVLRSSVGRFYQEQVIRSALALKLHQYDDTGAIIASCTASLPENVGGQRNWDYRYCWLRDAYYTLSALNHISHFGEVEKYSEYIQNIAVHEQDRYQPVYSITNESELPEVELDLQGYRNSVPVRIGNHAYTHVQNDVYGQVMLSLLPLYIDARFIDSRYEEARFMVAKLLAKIEATIDEPDAGIWEFRQKEQRHCYTFLFHWAGSLAAKKVAMRLGDKTLLHYAAFLEKESAAQMEKCYDAKRGVYRQAIETNHTDASLLGLVNMHYLDPQQEKTRRHIAALEKDLACGDGLFYRYKHADDFGKPQVAFLVCAFWHVEALARTGHLDKAIDNFEKLLKFQNHLGLMSEGYDLRNDCQSGNFPQTYSHVGLVNAAFSINNCLNHPEYL